MLNNQEIRQLTLKDILHELEKARHDLLKAQFNLKSGTSKEIHTARNLKKYIARLQTIKKQVSLDKK